MQAGDIVRVREGVHAGEIGVVIRSSRVYTTVYFQQSGETCAYRHHKVQRVCTTKAAAS